MRSIVAVVAGLMLAWCGRMAVAATEPPATQPAAMQPATTQPAAIVTVSAGIDEGKKVLSAKVTAGGKPVEGAKVAFFVVRTFGNLKLGEETTLDDGTAMVPFPEGLPGGPTGQLDIIARITAPERYASARATATVNGGLEVAVDESPTFPRAIWAPRAPWPLLVTFGVLLGGVWSTYLFVILQLRNVVRSGKL